MEKATVVSIGEILYDLLADQRGVTKDEVKSWVPYPGGAPANVVTGTARLGLHSILLGVLGSDKLGDDFVTLLEDRKVDTRFLQRSATHPTRDVLVTRTADGERTFAGFGKAKTNEYADCYLDADALPAEEIKSASVVVTGTLGLAYPGSEASIRRAAKLAKEGSATLVVDVNWRPVFWEGLPEAEAKRTILEFVGVADILKVTDEEAEWLLGIPRAEALQHPERVLSALPTVRGVLVSAGELGSAYAFAAPGGKMDSTGSVPIMKVKVADTTGAGDAFLAGFLFHMLRSGGLAALQADPEKAQESVRFATACGAFTCTQAGAIGGQPTLEDAQALLADQ